MRHRQCQRYYPGSTRFQVILRVFSRIHQFILHTLPPSADLDRRVAFGIGVGSLFNLAIAKWNDALHAEASAEGQRQAFQQILGAPFVPAVILLVSLCWCMESPRYYMQPNTPHRNPSRAYKILLSARQTQVGAQPSPGDWEVAERREFIAPSPEGLVCTPQVCGVGCLSNAQSCPPG